MSGHTKMDKYGIRMVMALISIPTIPLLFLMWWPLTPLEIKSVTILNKDKKVLQGEELLFEVAYVKHTNLSGTVYRQLINDRVINYSPHVSSVPLGEAKRVGYLRISKTDCPGGYQLNYTVIYKYFGFREVVVSKLSDKFQVIQKGE
jgi:hypothetical protein